MRRALFVIFMGLICCRTCFCFAESSRDGNSGDSFVIDEASGSSQQGRPGGELRRYCMRRDHKLCADECRKYFDDTFHRCRQECLDRRCVLKQEPDPKKESVDRKDDSSFCIELESKECVERCDSRSGEPARLRCRRACLIERCPQALQADASKEAMNPGTLACNRCKEGVKETCQQACRGGMAAGGSTYNGLVGFGCHFACAQTRCAEKCPAVPFPN